jgi:hypothetical protein
MTIGVTNNGVQFYQVGDKEYFCTLYLAEGIEHSIHLKDSSIRDIEKLSLDDFLPKQKIRKGVIVAHGISKLK